MSDSPNTPEAGARWRIWTRRLGPWIVTAAVITALLYRYPLSQIGAHMRAGTWWPVLVCTCAAVFSTIFVIAFSDIIVIRRALGPIGYGDVVKGRATASLLTALNQAASSGLYGVWMARVTAADLRTTLGAVGYITLADVAALAVLTSAGVWLGGDDLPAATLTLARVGAPAVALVIVGFGVLGPSLLGRRASLLLRPWARVSASWFLTGLVARVVVVSTFTVACWAAAAGFGLSIPLSAMAVRLPLILVVGTLPVNALGFGPVQVMWLLFDPWASGEQILAFQVIWQLALTLAMIALGAPFLRRTLAQIASRSRKTVDSETRST